MGVLFFVCVGCEVPDVVFKTRVRVEGDTSENPFDWKDVTTDDYFANKRVVLFALPGAFTPTCSSTHLPGYEAKYAEIRAAGIDEVIIYILFPSLIHSFIALMVVSVSHKSL